MDLVQYFYNNIIGYPVKSDEDYIQSKCTIEYLQDCGFSDKEIVNLLDNWDRQYIVLRPYNIPSIAWKDSILEKNKFYMHKELRLFSPPPKAKPDGTEEIIPYYAEPKIKYTVEDALNYFYNQCAPHAAKNIKLHVSQINHILSRFKSYKDVQPIDLFLFLVDECSYQNFRCVEPFDLTSVSSIVQDNYEKLLSNLKELIAMERNKPTWRTQYRTSDMNSEPNFITDFKENII